MTSDFERLKAMWEGLSPDQQAEYRDDYQHQILSSSHDAGDHVFAPIFEMERRS